MYTTQFLVVVENSILRVMSKELDLILVCINVEICVFCMRSLTVSKILTWNLLLHLIWLFRFQFVMLSIYFATTILPFNCVFLLNKQPCNRQIAVIYSHAYAMLLQLISSTDRHRQSTDHPIKFISRRQPHTLKFKIKPGIVYYLAAIRFKLNQNFLSESTMICPNS